MKAGAIMGWMLAAAVGLAVPAAAKDPPPPMHFRLATLEKCRYSSHTAQAIVRPDGDGVRAMGWDAVAGGVFSGLIDKGFDLFAAWLKAAAAEKSVQIESYHALELAPKAPTGWPACLQLARVATHDASETRSAANNPQGDCTRPVGGDEFFLEVELHRDNAGRHVALRPTCARIGAPLVKGMGTREYVVLAGLLKPRRATGLTGNTLIAADDPVGLLVLGEIPPRRGVFFHPDMPRSPWFPFDMPTTAKMPVTLSLTVTETKRAHAFLNAVADVLISQKPAITGALKESLIAQEAEKARLARIATLNLKQVDFASKRDAVVAACADYYAGKPAPFGADFRAKALNLATSYIDLRTAAIDAGMPTSHPASLAVAPTNDAESKALCETLRPPGT